MERIIQAVFTTVRQQDLPTFRRLLPHLKIGELAEEESIKLADLLSRVILDNAKNPREFLREGFTEWKKNYPPEKNVIGEMLRAPFVLDEVILDVTKVLDFHYLDYINTLVLYPDSEKNIEAVERMHRLVGLQSPDEYRACLKYLRPRLEKGNKPTSRVNMYLYRFLEAQLRQVSEFVPAPSYLLDEENVEWSDEEGLDDPTSIPFVIPDTEEATSLILKSMESIIQKPSFEERDAMRKEIAKDYEQEGNDRMRIRFLQPVYVEHFGLEKQDPERFRQWGPANPFVLAKGAINPQSSRMFTCIRYVNEDEFEFFYLPKEDEDYYVFDWFKGYCERCDRRIQWYHHAVRMPVEDGGWMGCYCSWKCVRKDLRSEGELVDQVSPYPMRLRLLNVFQPMFEKYGIYDRPIEEDADTNNRVFDTKTEEMVLLALEMETEGEREY